MKPLSHVCDLKTAYVAAEDKEEQFSLGRTRAVRNVHIGSQAQNTNLGENSSYVASRKRRLVCTVSERLVFWVRLDRVHSYRKAGTHIS